MIINYFITVLKQTTKNQHFRFLHLFSSVYKPGDMTRTEIKKRKCSGIQMHFPWALTCNFVHDLSTLNL